MISFLTINNLSISSVTTGNTIVEPTSFSVQQGAPLNLVGETGSGKSLIAQAILGTLDTTLSAQGEIWIDGTEYLCQPLEKRRQIWGKQLSLLPQEPWLSLDPTQKNETQLAEVYRFLRGNTKKAATTQAKKDFRENFLEGSEQKFPYELSGGMAQRLAFCCTMAGETELILADEPTKGLDSDLRQDVVTQLLKFSAAGNTLLTITHDIWVAEQLAGTTIVLKNGQLIEQNKTKTLFAQPAHQYTHALIQAAPTRWQPLQTPSQQAATPVLTCKNISKSFGQNVLFSDITLDFHQGEIVGLCGPSGQGKSTLGNILLGLEAPDTGTVWRNPDDQAHQFLKLYQDPPAAFSPFVSVGKSLMDLMLLHSISADKVEELLSSLHIDRSILDRDPANISGGELQRLALLRALLLNPVFVFADEPTSRLDLLTQKETISLLSKTAQKTKCCVLLVSHDKDLLKNTCDRLISLETNRSCVAA